MSTKPRRILLFIATLIPVYAYPEKSANTSLLIGKSYEYIDNISDSTFTKVNIDFLSDTLLRHTITMWAGSDTLVYPAEHYARFSFNLADSSIKSFFGKHIAEMRYKGDTIQRIQRVPSNGLEIESTPPFHIIK